MLVVATVPFEYVARVLFFINCTPLLFLGGPDRWSMCCSTGCSARSYCVALCCALNSISSSFITVICLAISPSCLFAVVVVYAVTAVELEPTCSCDMSPCDAY